LTDTRLFIWTARQSIIEPTFTQGQWMHGLFTRKDSGNIRLLVLVNTLEKGSSLKTYQQTAKNLSSKIGRRSNETTTETTKEAGLERNNPFDDSN